MDTFIILTFNLTNSYLIVLVPIVLELVGWFKVLYRTVHMYEIYYE